MAEWIRLHPTAAGFLVAVLGAAGNAVQAAVDGEPTRAIVSALAAAVLAAVGKLVHGAVTPVVSPQLDHGIPLLPNPEPSAADAHPGDVGDGS